MRERHIEKLSLHHPSHNYLVTVEKEQAVYYEMYPGRQFESVKMEPEEVRHVLYEAAEHAWGSEPTNVRTVAEKPQRGKYEHFMVDIETLGTNPGDVVFEISVVRFDPLTGRHYQSWNQCLSIPYQQSAGFRACVATKRWWLEENGRDPEEENENADANGNDQLEELNQWIDKMAPQKKERRFWCRGANFDPVMLQPLFEVFGVRIPWAYWQWRDVRTLQGILEVYGVKVDLPREVAHTAYQDCIAQIAQVRQLLNLINGKGNA